MATEFPYLSPRARLVSREGGEATTDMRRWMTAVEGGQGLDAIAADLAALQGDVEALQAYLLTTPMPLASLPSAASVGGGVRAFINDGSNSTFSNVAAAGGSFTIPVYSDGANWRLG